MGFYLKNISDAYCLIFLWRFSLLNEAYFKLMTAYNACLSNVFIEFLEFLKKRGSFEDSLVWRVNDQG